MAAKIIIVRKIVRNNLLLLTLLLFCHNQALAFKKPVKKDYFASLRATKTNVRAGPGIQYPIKHTFKLRGIPIKIISEYDNWSEVKDYDGETGWINQNLITKRRTVIIKTKKKLH